MYQAFDWQTEFSQVLISQFYPTLVSSKKIHAHENNMVYK